MRVILACALLCAAIPAGGGAPARAQAAVSPPAAIRDGIAFAWDGSSMQRSGPAQTGPRPQRFGAPLTRGDVMRSEAESLVAFGLPASAVADTQNGPRFHSLYPAGDLDADGRDDLYEYSREGSDIRLAARSGDGGRIFWRRDMTGATYSGAIPATGPEGAGASILVVSVVSASRSKPWTTDKVLGLLMVTSDGTTVWERWWEGSMTVAGAANYSVSALADWPYPLAVASLTGDAASDAAVTQLSDVAGVAGTRIETVDGRSGDTAAAFEERGVTQPAATVVGDVTGDGYADVFFLSGGMTVPPAPPTPSLLTARRASDGAVAWRVAGPPASRYSWAKKIEDVSGDGRDDIMIVDYDRAWRDPAADRLFLIDGAAGAVLLSRAADGGGPIARRDERGRPLIGLWSAPFDWTAVHADYSIITMDGAVVAERPYSHPSETGTGTGSIMFDAGDLNGDGTTDGTYRFRWFGPSVHEEGAAVDGATATTLWTGIPAAPLWASTDGNGDDLADVDGESNTFRISDGRTNTLRWSRTFAALPWQWPQSADVNGDGNADLLVITGDPSSTGVVTEVLDGIDGATLWIAGA